MCEVEASLAGAVKEQCDKAAKEFAAESVVAATDYSRRFGFTDKEREYAYFGYLRGAQYAAMQMANTPEMSVAMQKAFALMIEAYSG